MNSLRRRLVDLLQRTNRRLNSAYLEQVYQTSYLHPAARTDWLTEPPLASPNGGTASFSLLCLLLSVLRDASPRAVLELGVGQSTRLFLQYARHHPCRLTLIE